MLLIILCQTQCQRITDAKALVLDGTVQVKILTLSLSSSNHIRTLSLASTAWLAHLYPPKGRCLPTGPDTQCCQAIPCHRILSERQTLSATVLWLRRFIWTHTQKTWDSFFCSLTPVSLTVHVVTPSYTILLCQTSFFTENVPLSATLIFHSASQLQSTGHVCTQPNSNCGQKSCLLHGQECLNLHVNQHT